MYQKVKINRYGYYELNEKPSSKELEDYYANKYYQEEKIGYFKAYSAEEITYFNNKITQKYEVIKDLLPHGIARKMLDIGCGEGWALEYFDKLKWEVKGIDYSSEGCNNHNPHIADKVIVGDIYQSIDKLVESNQRFDLIWLDNVLEHVLEPSDLLLKCKRIISDHGVLVIEVPNDFSVVQQQLLNGDMISKPFWVAIPDHISYFNQEGLKALCADYGWDCKMMLGDFPIDWSLFNPNTNYVDAPSTGPSCHKTRVQMENLLHQISIQKTNELYRVLADLGMGRQLIGFFQGSDIGGRD